LEPRRVFDVVVKRHFPVLLPLPKFGDVRFKYNCPVSKLDCCINTPLYCGGKHLLLFVVGSLDLDVERVLEELLQEVLEMGNQDSLVGLKLLTNIPRFK
jgi:hypothetical protein